MVRKKLYQPIIVKKELDDEHFYYVDNEFFPSVTKILGDTLPTPFALRKWLGDVGNERAQEKMHKAAERGTLIHEACERLVNGEVIDLDQEFPKKNDKKCLVAFVNWFAKTQPTLIPNTKPEMIVASRAGYAGTVDYPCIINGEPYLVDYKTSGGIYDNYKFQLVAYKRAFYEMTGIEAKMGILHLNYRTKTGYSFHDDDKMTVNKRRVTSADFLKILEVYKILNGGEVPKPKATNVYPDVIKLEQVNNNKKGGGE